jgi:hypothetical protein
VIVLPPEQSSDYVFVPRPLSVDYLGGVGGRSLGEADAITGCKATNLCTDSVATRSPIGRLAEGMTIGGYLQWLSASGLGLLAAA